MWQIFVRINESPTFFPIKEPNTKGFGVLEQALSFANKSLDKHLTMTYGSEAEIKEIKILFEDI